MIKHWIAAALVTLAPAVALAQAPSEGARAGALVQVPPNARLVGTSQVDEVREFPEQNGGKPMERIIGVSAIDRVYEVQKPYADAVKFFDAQFRQQGFQQTSRMVTATATAWVVRRPDGNVANVIVRNTSPSTVEAVEVVSAQAAEKK
jgi:hypothetical protein